jgi:hypothetical protein
VDDIDGMLIGAALLALAAAVLMLAAKVADLTEDLDLMTVPAGHPVTLLDSKRMIESRRAERAEPTIQRKDG